MSDENMSNRPRDEGTQSQMSAGGPDISPDGGGAVPLPAEGVGGGRRRRAKLMVLAGLVVVLVASLTVLSYYLLTKKPISQLPGVQAATRNVPPTYLFSIYNVSNPFGVAVSPDGQKVYVTEARGERQVRIFDRNGTQLFAFGPPDSTPSTRNPVHIAVAPDGQVYVDDQFKNAIFRFTADGKYLGTLQPNGDSNFKWAPLGVGFDAKGNLYVADALDQKDRVVVMGADARVKATMGTRGSGDGEMYAPQEVAVDKNGRIFVSDMMNARIVAFGPDGKFLASFGEGLTIPQGLAIDDQNRLYVVDTNGPNVQVFDLDNNFKPLFTFGSDGTGDGQFKFPRGVVVDKSGRVYVADFRNNRIQVWGY